MSDSNKDDIGDDYFEVILGLVVIAFAALFTLRLSALGLVTALYDNDIETSVPALSALLTGNLQQPWYAIWKTVMVVGQVACGIILVAIVMRILAWIAK